MVKVVGSVCFNEAEQATAAEGEAFNRDGDMRGMAYAVTNANGDVVTSGSLPAAEYYGAVDARAKAGYYADMVDKVGGALHVAPLSSVKPDAAPSEPLIFGMTWQQIQDKQQGKPISSAVRAKMPEGAVEVYRTSDRALTAGSVT